MIELRLLGPLEAAVDGTTVRLPRGKPRALLARLALDAGRVVSTEALLEALWDEHPPASARKLLQAYVSQLRKTLGADAIETRAPGYRLAGAVRDLRDFERRVEEARADPDPARRARGFRDALALWRGEPLEDVPRERFAQAAARRLDELRLDAVAQRIDAELALGDHEQVVAELAVLVAAEPLREQPRRQLMLALYRGGRQADALAAYREGRRLLVDELGIEPSTVLQELERAILRRDPTLDGPRERAAPARGPVVCAGSRAATLLAPLCVRGRELMLVELAPASEDLSRVAERLATARAALPNVAVRTASFVSADPGADLVRLATEQGAELLAVDGLPAGEVREQMRGAPCDVAFSVGPEVGARDRPVVVPFGGGPEEWAALELGAWLARALGVSLLLLGTQALDDRRDASRMLAAASLALQRFEGTVAASKLVAAGAAGILAEPATAITAALPAGDLDATRRELVERTTAPLLLVQAGLRPGGLAPDRTLTRFSWSLRDAEQR